MDPRDSIWYFPGDPPVFETVATFSLLIATALIALGVIVFLATIPKMARKLRHPLLRLNLILMLLLVIPLGFAIFGIASRHFGEWGKLKALLRHYSDLVATEAEKSRGTAQLPELEMRFLNPRPAFKFKALKEPVHLRLMQTTSPYVGVDFGNGANAVFDPSTMICIYSD